MDYVTRHELRKEPFLDVEPKQTEAKQSPCKRDYDR